MAMDTFNPAQSISSSSPFRSPRSYPSLNQISLAPLTPRFPIDDGDNVDGADDSAARNDPTTNPARTSYLSSSSVPGTPSLLSHSRSASRVRRHHSRSKSSNGGLPLTRSDTNPNVTQVFQHHQHQHHPHPHHNHHHHHQDPEWMLRTAIALASSTREEKGQSWLAKRESSTSLVSDVDDDVALLPKHHHHHQHNKVSRKTMRSGKSTPAAYSRHTSRQASRRGSRADLTMMPGNHPGSRLSRSGIASPVSIGSSSGLPDFVDERIRAEMASIQRDLDARDDLSYSSDEDENEPDSEDEIDEQEMQRLTRERGFGLGSWLDRLVEWTLFSVDEWPSPRRVQQQRDTVIVANQSSLDDDVQKNPGNNTSKAQPHDDDESQSETTVTDRRNDDTSATDKEEEEYENEDDVLPMIIEKPGEEGGWEDAGWLLRVVKRALL